MGMKLKSVQGYKFHVNISCVKVDPVLNAPELSSEFIYFGSLNAIFCECASLYQSGLNIFIGLHQHSIAL